MDFMDIKNVALTGGNGEREETKGRRGTKEETGRGREKTVWNMKYYFICFTPVFHSCNNKTQPFIILDI